jgi:hypothetical protein
MPCLRKSFPLGIKIDITFLLPPSKGSLMVRASKRDKRQVEQRVANDGGGEVGWSNAQETPATSLRK